MRLNVVRRGQTFDVYAIDHSEDPAAPDCPAKEFIATLGQVKGSQKSMTALLTEHADNGPILNDQKSRHLEDGIYEFKNRQGARLFWFYHPTRKGVTVLTHGAPKRKERELRGDIARAKEMRVALEEAGL